MRAHLPFAAALASSWRLRPSRADGCRAGMAVVTEGRRAARWQSGRMPLGVTLLPSTRLVIATFVLVRSRSCIRAGRSCVGFTTRLLVRATPVRTHPACGRYSPAFWGACSIFAGGRCCIGIRRQWWELLTRIEQPICPAAPPWAIRAARLFATLARRSPATWRASRSWVAPYRDGGSGLKWCA
jgi:hypothetical protein